MTLEAHLHAFEATATREAGPRATDYEALKAEILSRGGLTKFGMAQRFHSCTFQPDQPPRAQMHELVRITRKWLDPEKSTTAAVVEAVVVDKYLRALPYEAKRLISQQALTTADLTVEAVERYQATAEMLRASRKEPQSASPPQTGGARPKNPKGSNPATSGAVQAPGGARNQPESWMAQERPPTCPVTVNHHDVEALLDSGSRVTLVHKDLVDSSYLTPGKVLPVSCVHGDTRDYPTTELAMTTTRGTILTTAGVVDSLPVPVLIGRDCPAFHQLWRETQERLTRVPRKRRGMAGAQADSETGPDTEEENMVPGSAPISSEEDVHGTKELPPLTGQYGTAQLQDPTLTNALKNVQVIEGVVLGDRTSPTYPHFAVNRG
ncbi:uncharacterized protein LOC125295597 [Alosa alosa]|uniref:uncharacterized protein LOC125295597 n=1 Tax=Alosa alosa TaxID=278164 RepID=UPI00201516DE|nr:uncharacterized protein LOC125295597 [Alosa alosa]